MALTDSPDGVSQSFAGTAVVPGGQLASSNPSAARLAQAGAQPGAEKLFSGSAGSVFNINFMNQNGTPISAEDDWRVRISLASYTADLFYRNPNNVLLQPLNSTNGVVFPYVPTVTLQHQARYQNAPLTHSNYASYFYEGSEIQAIQINGDFTVQNISEGQYLMAVIQFFRSMTKMFWGSEANAGSPPPLVYLDGYGPAYLPHIPSVVTLFNHTMPADVDYLEIPIGVPLNTSNLLPNGNANTGGKVRLPTTSQISVTLQPVYSRNNISDNFTLSEYARGGLIQNGTSKIGGFI